MGRLPYLEGSLDLLGLRGPLDLHHKIGQRQALEGDELPHDPGEGFGAVDKAFVLVYDVDDGGELPRVLAVVHKDHAADLNIPCVALEAGGKKCKMRGFRKTLHPSFPL